MHYSHAAECVLNCKMHLESVRHAGLDPASSYVPA